MTKAYGRRAVADLGEFVRQTQSLGQQPVVRDVPTSVLPQNVDALQLKRLDLLASPALSFGQQFQGAVGPLKSW